MEILKEKETIPDHFLCAEERLWERAYPAHGHDFFELEYILSGTGAYEIDGVCYRIAPDTVFLMTPARIHSVNGIGCRAINVSFSGAFFREKAGFALLSDQAPPSIPLSQKEDITLLRELLRELIAVQTTEREYATLLLRCVLQKLARNVSVTKTEAKPLSGYLRETLIFLSENFRRPLTLGETAAKAGLSRAYFSNLFSGQTGIPFKTYLDNLRFSYACKLLILTELTAGEICTRSGFEDYANFMRRFRCRYGMSPMTYRRTHAASRNGT